MDLPEGIVFINGNNGHGKSNLLEAIHILVAGKSQRAINDSEIVLRNDNIVKDHAQISVNVVRKDQNISKVEMDLISKNISSYSNEFVDRENEKLIKFNKVFKVNGNIIKVSDFIGRINAVIFTAKDLDLVYGGPNLRRKYLDLFISQMDKKYIKCLQNFNRIVSQRNHLLKAIRSKKSSEDQLEQWDDFLVDSAQYLIRSRSKVIQSLTEKAKPLHSELSKNDSVLDIKYQPSIKIDTDSSVEENSDFIKNLFASNRSKELHEGVTLFGPHRDDFLMTLDEGGIASYSSRGQSRTFLLALKLAEAELLTKMLGEEPILLLDDIMSELDKFRQSYIMDRLTHYQQCIVTSAESEILNQNVLPIMNSFNVENGLITKKF